MKKVTVRAPVRADLAGGTLDLWPLYLFHPGARTVNVAISCHAESEVAQTGESTIEVHLTDLGYRQRYESLDEMASDPKTALLHRLVEHFHLTGLRITTRTDAPRGSGLGGSSALAITLVRALAEIAGAPVDGDDLIALVRDLETRFLGIPAGIQDYYPPVYGGLAALHLNPGVVSRHPIALPIADLSSHFLLHYTGVAHFSGTNNWEMYKRQIEGKKKVVRGLSRIAQAATEMEKALETGNFEAAGRALQHEWKSRKAMIEGISTPEVDAAIEAATSAGAWAGKVCGAGGGGCIIFLLPPERRDDVRAALAHVPGSVLDAVPVPHGLTIETADDTQSGQVFLRGRLAERPSAALEQLYVYGTGRGTYRPFVLAEAVVTHNEPRSGVHQTIIRSYVAQIHEDDGSVQWAEARPLDPDTLDIRAVPDPHRKLDTHATAPEEVMRGVIAAEDAFRQFLEETERLQVFHNPAFAMYSEPPETRDAFVERCLDEATRRLEEEAERLEGTFRRRIDQLREKSEREQREIDAQEESDGIERPQDVNLAWGQALYNITSGRPAAVTDAPHSVREVDYLGNIALIQKAWDRELQSLREELTSKARSIEELNVAPAPKNIEVTKYLILWATRL